MRRNEAERLARRLEQAARGAGPGPEGDLGARDGVRAADGAHDGGAHDELSGLVSLAQTLEASAAEPSPRFKTALRERVLASAGEEPPQPVWRAHLRGVVADTVAAWRYSVSSQVASGALTAVMLLAALFIGAGMSVPGDPLYVLKDAYQQAQLSRASAPVDIASVQLSMAATKIEETVRAAERDQPDSLISSATDAEQLVRDSSQALLEVRRDTGNDDVLAPIPAFVERHRPVVRGLQARTDDADARRALANLMITMDRAKARVNTALSECCAPEQQASAFWVMSSPYRMLRECPCPHAAPLADDDPDDEGGDGEGGSGAPALQPAPSPTTGDAPEPEPLPEDMREGWDETRDGVRDTLEDVTEGTEGAVDDPVDGVDDDLPAPDDDTTDQLREELEDSAEAVDETGDAVEDTTEGVEAQGVDEALPEGSNSVDGSVGDQLNAETQSSEETGSGSDETGEGGDDGDDGGDGDPSLEGVREEEDDEGDGDGGDGGDGDEGGDDVLP